MIIRDIFFSFCLKTYSVPLVWSYLFADSSDEGSPDMVQCKIIKINPQLSSDTHWSSE